MEKSQGSPNIYNLALQYFDDLDNLIEIINTIYGHINYRSLKVKLTKMKNKIISQSSDSEIEQEQALKISS